MPNPRTVLCPVDFSEQSRRALVRAATLARERRVIVLNAVDPLLAEAARIRLGIDLLVAEVEPALRRFVEAAPIASISTNLEISLEVRIGQPGDVILETAAAAAPELIVMGTNGLSGVRKWILGSTTERVLRRTETPVLAMPAGREETSTVLDRPLSSPVRSILAAIDFSETSEKSLQCVCVRPRERTRCGDHPRPHR